MSATSNAAPDLFQRVVRAQGIAYFEWTPGEDRIHPSPALATLFDLDPEDWTVQRMLGHMHPDDLPGYKAALTAFMKSDAERTEITYRYHRRDGGLRWCLNHYYAERDAGGRVTRLTTIATDITKEKEQEAANRALLARQEASVEVLKAITASPDDPQPVFELIAQKVKELYGAHAVSVVEYDGELLHQRALIGHEPEAAARLLAAFPRPPGPETGPGRVFLSGKPVYFRHIDNESGIIPAGRTASLGVGSYFAVPLLHEGRVVGVLGLWRADFGEFNESLVEVAQAFAEQAVIAIAGAKTLRELRERDAENRALIARQQASIEVLKAISESPDDTQPVFELIARHARTLCGATSVSMTEYDGTLMHARVSDWADPEARDAWFATYPRPPGPETGHGRATLSGKTGHVRDVSADPLIYQAGRRVSTGSSMHVPLLRDGRAIGAIVLLRAVAGGFTASEAALVESFAEQTSLAIASATTLRNLRARTAELQEALDQQTATTEVLGVINASPGDLTPVFDAMLERALRLCGAYGGGLLIQDGADLKYRAMRGMPTSFTAMRLGQASGVDSDSPPGRMLRTGRTIQVVDTLTDPYFVSRPELRDQTTGLGGARSVLNVPLLKDAAVCGAFVIFRETPGAWPDRQIALLENFAAQAVVAMDNARLLTETREALEQQTATTEVLQVINASPGDLAPVFDAILEKSLQLAQSAFGIIYLHDNDIVQAIASRAVPAALKQYYAGRQPPRASTYPPARRLKETKRGYQLLDIREGENYRAGVPGPRAVAELGGARSLMDVPLIKDQEVIGSILIYRQEVRAFTEKHIALLENFAAQAVIAMENARLLTETREALERQTATADVLRVINAHPGNVVPVFDAILESAHRVCGASIGSLWLYDGEMIHAAATRGMTEEASAQLRQPRPPSVVQEAMIRERNRYYHSAEHRTDDARINPEIVASGAQTILAVPLIKDGRVTGLVSARRLEARPFTEREIELLENFAAQAVIAMENARLLTETREALEQQTATAEVLGVINANPGNLAPVFDSILEKSLRICQSAFGALLIFDGSGMTRMVSERGVTPVLAEFRARNPQRPLSRVARQVITTRRPVHHLDIREEEGYRRGEPGPTSVADLGGGRSLLVVPLMKDGEAAGVIQVYRTEVRAFTDKEITLLENFAAQAVIAMENARLLGELRTALETTQATLRELKIAQANLVQAEKMASLGQLTAGIAHEIKNPLNFVNNFAALSVDLLEELKETAAPGFAALTDDQRADIDDVSAMLTTNLQKITEHGKRADGIVKAMLEHSRGSSGERREVDLNALVDEALNLAYHGARAQDQSFNITLERDFTTGIPPIELNPQDMTRVFLNMFTNGFYAANKRAKGSAKPGFEPVLEVSTRAVDDTVEIRIRDNGTGIPPDIRDKLFQPFFTTKPTGEGTGLGLSITYDIVTKAHGGSISVDSEEGSYTEFTVSLPRRMFETTGERA